MSYLLNLIFIILIGVFFNFLILQICAVKFYWLLLSICVVGFAKAQDSLQSKALEEVVITATKTEKPLDELPMPVSLISRTQIRTIGSLRLNDVLLEQTGLAVVPQINGTGNGLQLQGLNPDYTLILIDGEPVIGRFGGSIELTRLTVGNIKQIEIVKGPSSSLYGSEALAGVVNIITEKPSRGSKGNIFCRYGTNNTLDTYGEYGLTKGKWGGYIFADRYSTDGYSLSSDQSGKTVSPFQNYTTNLNLTYKLSKRTDISLGGRFFREKQKYSYEVKSPDGQVVSTDGDGLVYDWNLKPTISHRFNDKLKATAKYYRTDYSTATTLKNLGSNTVSYSDDFAQSFQRAEVTGEYFFNKKNFLTMGLGTIFESVKTSRYADLIKRRQETGYIFLQHEWNPLTKWNVIAGVRYDNNSVYGHQLSPKLSMRYEINNNFAFKGSVGVGFKAPDFRQLYLNFNNSAGGGYSVLGAEVVRAQLELMAEQGLIKNYLLNLSNIGKLQAERSIALNFGTRFKPLPLLTADINLFYNSIDNLIENQAVAVTNANQTIYSYRNIKRAFTEGIESNFTYTISKKINFSIGYQLLFAKDKDVISRIKSGEVYWRDPNTLISNKLEPNEYFGLYNRSRHMGNAKIFFSDKKLGLDASARVIYRGKYGIGDMQGNLQGQTVPSSDTNGNGILDIHDDFVHDYVVVNLSVAKNFINHFRLQISVDNIFNYVNAINIPNIPGRLFNLNVGYFFNNNQ